MQLIHFALDSALTVPLLLLAIGWILLISLRPLLRIGDAEPASSPLESMSLGRMNAMTDGSVQPRGVLGKRIAGWFDITSQHASMQPWRVIDARHRRDNGWRWWQPAAAA